MGPLLPEHKTNHQLGTHRKQVDNRATMNAILFVGHLEKLPPSLPEQINCHDRNY